MLKLALAMPFPIAFEDVCAARDRLRPYLPPTALRAYAPLDAAVGAGIRVYVKHENHQPTSSFKVRNGLSVLTALGADERRRGVVAATRGNHGLGLAYAGALLGVEVTICVPRGNNPEKNEAVRGYGATLLEEGRDYDEAVVVATRLVEERGLRMVHSTNDVQVIAGAGTLTLELLEQEPELDALVYAVGGGSQAVGGLVAARALRPDLPVFGVQAAGAPAMHDSWHAGAPIAKDAAVTFADGLATRSAYPIALDALRDPRGLADFVLVTDDAIRGALALLIRTTHNLAEGAGAAGLAGLFALRERLEGMRVGIVLSGSNIDARTLREVLAAYP